MRITLSLISALTALSLALQACSTPRKATVGEVEPPGHGQETVVIFGFNDIHGAISPIPAKTKEAPGVEPISYERGGLNMVSSYLKLARQRYGKNLLVLDAGDQFQGSLDSNLLEGAPMVQFFNHIGLDAASVGNHEFDFGPVGPGEEGDPRGALKARMLEAHYPYLTANIFYKKDGRPQDFPNTKAHQIFTAGGVKVGVIGLTTETTPSTTLAAHVADLNFTSLVEATLRESKELRAQGVDIVIALAHAGLKCQIGRANPSYTIRKPSDPLGDCDRDEIVRLLHTLPAGTLDAVVAGHSHQVVHHWVNQVPVIQAGTRAAYLNLLYLTYDHTAHKLITDRTRIEGPIPVCPKVFENTLDCEGDRPAPREGRGRLVTPYFHGQAVQPDPEIDQLFAPMFEKTAAIKARVIGQALHPIEHVRAREAELGNLIADAVRDKVGADVAMVNAGGIRASLESGPITYESLFRVLPFDNGISMLKVTGQELKTILRVGQNGIRGVFPISGAKLRLIELGADAPSTDLNHDRKIDSWEVNRLIELRIDDGTPKGKPVIDSKLYKFATVDFLVTGGDDMGWAMSQVPKDRIEMMTGPLIRDTVQDYIGKNSPLGQPEHPLLDPSKPRIKFEAAPAHSSKKRHRRRRNSSL